ncbi:MAG: VaFE repeat-containing surface-anchored protein [Muricomes sp.]
MDSYRFNPYGLEKYKNTTITDTLPEGLSLILNADGTLADNAVTVTEYTATKSGGFPPESEGVASSIKPSYDPLTRKLTFKPEAGKLYKIEYSTLVSPDVKASDVLKNEVTLDGDVATGNKIARAWNVSSSWANSRVERVGMLQITKTDAVNNPLAGAEFGLFTDPGCTNMILSASSQDTTGLAAIRAIPAPQTEGPVWTYYLKETKAPSGYAVDPTVRKVTVRLGQDAEGHIRTFTRIEGNPDDYENGRKLTVSNQSENEVGNLMVSKAVEMGDQSREFNFTISTDNNAVKGKTYAATGKASSITFDANGVATIRLADSEHIIIHNLPKDMQYTVAEDDYNDVYKTTVSENGGNQAAKNEYSGTIAPSATTNVAFTNRGRDMGIATTAVDKDTKSHTGTIGKESVIIDTVKYQDLVIGREYTVKGTLMDKATGQPLLIGGKEVTGETTFTAEKENGSVDITFTLDSSALAGKSVVVFERLYQNGDEIAVHTNINDEAQTVHYPNVRTTATDKDTASNAGKVDKKATIVDRVRYENLVPGTEYTVKGILMDKETGKALLVDGKEVKGEKTFTALEPQGFVDMEFELDSSALAGKSVVVFEDLYQGGIKVVSHSDLNDEAQTIHYPEIGTNAADKDTKSNTGTVGKKTTIVDKVDYKNLVPGKEYVVKGTLMDKATKKPLLVGGKEVKGETTFIPTAANGTVNVEFTLDSSELAGKSVVVFEDLYQGGAKITSHADINDKAQTVHYPKIDTNAADKDTKSNAGTVGKKTTIIDKVSYENLVPGKEYVVKGILMDKEIGKALLVNGKEITSEKTFTAKDANGFAEMEFELDSSALAGKSVVVFEDLYQNGVKIVSHADINDKAQTITYQKDAGSKAAKTGDATSVAVWIGLFGSALALCVLIILNNVVRKKRR